MAVIFVHNDSGDDSDDGSTEALAKATIQGGVDAAAASGDIVAVKEGSDYTEAVSVTKKVEIVGYSGTWDITNDPGDYDTRIVVDAENTRSYCFDCDQAATEYSGIILRNFECKNSTGAGIMATYTQNWKGKATFINVYSHDNSGDGFDCNVDSTYLNCEASDNGDSGFKSFRASCFIDCVANNNTGYGYEVTSSYVDSCVRCEAQGNGYAGSVAMDVLVECSFDDNTDAVYPCAFSNAMFTNVFVGTQITNNTDFLRNTTNVWMFTKDCNIWNNTDNRSSITFNWKQSETGTDPEYTDDASGDLTVENEDYNPKDTQFGLMNGDTAERVIGARAADRSTGLIKTTMKTGGQL